MAERLKRLVAQYGKLALMIYFAIFLLVLAGFAIAIQLGVEVQSAAGAAGTLGAAWVATKLTQPLRIAATLALTPVVGAIIARRRPAPAPEPRDGERGEEP